jgi:hypothetical protein
MSLKLFSFIVALCVLASCSIEESLESVDQIYPIRTGNAWTYLRTQVFEDSIFASDTIQMKVGKKTKVKGVSGYSFDNHEIFDLLFLVENDKYGNYITYGCYNDSFLLFDRSIRFKLHAKKNERWNYESCSWGWYTGTKFYHNQMKCLSVDTLVTVLGKEYNCMLFRESADDFIRYSFLSVNIGLIKQQTVYRGFQFNDGWVMNEELITY